MIRRGTWILLAVFVVLLAGTLYLQFTGKMSAVGSQSTPVPTEAALFKFDTGKFSQFSLQKSDGESVQAQAGSDGKWTVTAPQGSPVTAAQIESAILEIQGWTVMSELNPAPPLNAMGLNSPGSIIVLTSQSGQEQKIAIGNTTPTESGYYLQLNGGTPLIVSKSMVDPVLQVIPARPTETAAPGQNQTQTPAP